MCLCRLRSLIIDLGFNIFCLSSLTVSELLSFDLLVRFSEQF